MSTSILRFAPLAFVLVSFAARADTVADWADITTRIATDGPNSVRTMAQASSIKSMALSGKNLSGI